jgi:hypothetical protein
MLPVGVAAVASHLSVVLIFISPKSCPFSPVASPTIFIVVSPKVAIVLTPVLLSSLRYGNLNTHFIVELTDRMFGLP